jgi:hypothetical protein
MKDEMETLRFFVIVVLAVISFWLTARQIQGKL